MRQSNKLQNVLHEIQINYSPKLEESPTSTIRSSFDANEILKLIYPQETIEFKESAYVLYLTRSNIVLGWYLLSTGSISATIIDVRQILMIGLKINACGIILSHNHPSGSLIPSMADNKITRKVKKACELMDMTLIDHIIVSRLSYYSYSDEGKL